MAAVGIGAAGWIDADPLDGAVRAEPGLARRAAARAASQRAVGLPVVVENDGNVAAWAEFRYGAARDADDSMVLFTVGTGIGGGIVLGGELVRGAQRHRRRAGPRPRRCPDGPPVRLRPARLPRAVRQRQRPGPVRPGPAPRQDPDRRQRAARPGRRRGRGDHRADGHPGRAGRRPGRRARRSPQIGHWLGSGLADMVQILDPQMLVVGGGVIDAGDLLLGPTRAALLGAARRARPPAGRGGASRPSWATAPAWSAPPTWPARDRAAGMNRAPAPLRVVSYNMHSQRDDRPRWPRWSAACAPGRGDRAGGAAPVPVAQKSRHLADRFGLVVRRPAALPALGNLVLDQPAGPGARHRSVQFPLTPGRHLRGGRWCAAGSAAPGSPWPARTCPPAGAASRAGAAELAAVLCRCGRTADAGAPTWTRARTSSDQGVPAAGRRPYRRRLRRRGATIFVDRATQIVRRLPGGGYPGRAGGPATTSRSWPTCALPAARLTHA